MTLTEEDLAVVFLVVFFVGWGIATSISLDRAHDKIRRLDKVLSEALTALGFPKKEPPQ